MTTRGLPRALWLGIALIVVPFLILIGILAYEVVGLAPSLVQSRELVAHAYQVIDTARALDRAMQRAEHGERGYLLTGDPAYLEPYRSDARDAPMLLARLFELTGDNPEQQRRRPALELQINARLAALQRALEVRDRSGLDAAREAMRTDQGLLAMRVIEDLIDAAIATENGLLRERLTAMADNERRGADLSLWSAVLSFAIMTMGIAVALVTFRGVQHAEMAQGLSEQRFRLLADGVADHAIYTLDTNGNIVDWNAGAQRLKGYSAEEIGTHFSRFYTPGEREAGVPQRALETAVREDKYEAEGWRVRKDGSRAWASATISPLREPSGRLVGFVKVTRDVTERREQQAALEKAHEALAQSQKHGPTVKLYLPRLVAVADEEIRTDVVTRMPPTGSEAILVVEDDDVRAFTSEILRELGYRVVAAPDAASALRVLEDGAEVRLLFTDVGLPDGVNGRQLADRVRARRPDIKVLYTTGYARNAIVHHGRLDPDVELIVKAYTQSALAEKVRRVLDRGDTHIGERPAGARTPRSRMQSHWRGPARALRRRWRPTKPPSRGDA